jgi:hypothetical protein
MNVLRLAPRVGYQRHSGRFAENDIVRLAGDNGHSES